MRKYILFFYFIVGYTLIAGAQEASIKGTLLDTAENRTPHNAVISLLKQDSTLVRFTRSDQKGNFLLNKLDSGKYKLLITFPKYADYAEEIQVLSGQILDMGKILMTHKATLLKEVVIRSGQAIRIKGDTTEFTADSFVVREGATVEELLKKLPGFQVNSKGEIVAQGQRVNKVLVDGEEFFGDDPTMATQNISAKAVDKVQLFDTKTDQQQLTGMSTGTEGKTVNIKLKENMKKGAFGKFFAGSDHQRYNDAKLLYNRFTGKKKMSVYGTKSTVNTGSLNWQEREKLGMQSDMEYDEVNDYYYSYMDDGGFNDWNLRGLPDSYTAGALFSNKWNNDRNNINTSYRFNRLGTENTNSTISQNILGNTVTYSNRNALSDGYSLQHALNAKYEWNVDSFSSFKYVAAGSYKNTTTHNTSYSDYLNSKREFININNQENDFANTRLQNDHQLTYKQLFRKKNRQLIVNVRYGLTIDEQEGYIFADTDFYLNGQFSRDSITDQYKKFDGKSRTLGTKITFNEPLNNKWSIVGDYSFNVNQSSSNRNTFNKSSNGKYESFSALFSNNFDLAVNSNSGLALLKYSTQKLNFAFGSGFSSINLKLNNLDKEQLTTYNFLNYTPRLQVRYNFKPQTRLSFSYNGTTRQPGINQLQPIRDNNDPLNIFIGNPDLKVAFNHNLNLNYNFYKVLSSTGLWTSLRYETTRNAITMWSSVDTVKGLTITTPVNVRSNNRWNFYSSWYKGGGENKFNYGLDLNSSGGTNINFINNQQNTTTYASIGGGPSFGYNKKDKYNFDLRPNIRYNISRSSLNTRVDNNYFSYGGSAEFYVKLPGKFELNSDLNLDLRQRISAFDRNTNLIVWNANLAKSVLKDKSGKIMLVANDLLNQNKGFSRYINSNVIQDDRYSRISRYFLLKFEWSFNKMPSTK